jgi:hypothetical protein
MIRGMKLPTLRATEATGDSWDDPEEDRLRDLLLGLAADNRFLVVERHDRTSLWQHYMQAYLNDDGTYALEFREGGPQAHYRVATVKPDRAVEIVLRWSADEPGWREALPWERWDPTDS